jgi:hypothetical protein
MEITTYNQHCSAPFSEPWSSTAAKFTRLKEPTTSSNQPTGAEAGKSRRVRRGFGKEKRNRAADSRSARKDERIDRKLAGATAGRPTADKFRGSCRALPFR